MLAMAVGMERHRVVRTRDAAREHHLKKAGDILARHAHDRVGIHPPDGIVRGVRECDELLDPHLVAVALLPVRLLEREVLRLVPDLVTVDPALEVLRRPGGETRECLRIDGIVIQRVSIAEQQVHADAAREQRVHEPLIDLGDRIYAFPLLAGGPFGFVADDSDARRRQQVHELRNVPPSIDMTLRAHPGARLHVLRRETREPRPV